MSIRVIDGAKARVERLVELEHGQPHKPSLPTNTRTGHAAAERPILRLAGPADLPGDDYASR